LLSLSMAGRADFFQRLLLHANAPTQPEPEPSPKRRRTGWAALDVVDKGGVEVIPDVRVRTKEPVCAPSIPKSVEDAVRPLTVMHMHASQPLFSPSSSIRIVNEALAHAVAHLSAVPVGDSVGHIPVATVRDDITQLSWGRVSKKTGEAMPLCFFAENKCSAPFSCASVDQLHSHGPLHGHLTPTEEARFQAEGLASIPLDRPCLLCERRDMAALIEIHGGLVNPERQYGHGIVWPLCVPLVNTPGGYTFEACYPVSNIVPAPIVRADIPLSVCNDMGPPHFDQGVSVFGIQASPLN
jgi:hypothetical protein